MILKTLPFAGVLYSPEQVSSLADVVSPPYDVIDEKLRAELYARSPYNFCRVDFSDDTSSERYHNAAGLYQSWLNDGILTRDKSPAFYIHHHEFTTADGRRVTRKGFFVARLAESFAEGGVKPHEKTLDAPKADRLMLMRASEAQFSPVFALYSDPQNRLGELFAKMSATTPFFDFMTVDSRERHRLWRVKDSATLLAVSGFLGDAPVFIADGHHRYETAVTYREEFHAANPGRSQSAAANHTLMYLSSMDDDGLIVLPIHRAVTGISGFDFSAFLLKISAIFEIEDLDAVEPSDLTAILAKRAEKDHAFVFVSPGGERSVLATLSHASGRELLEQRGLPSALAQLDISILHRLIFEEILGMSELSQARQENLSYFKTTESALAQAHDDANFVVLLNPTPVWQMREAASAGLKMPQKSTFFYPKVPSGLVIHSVSADDCDGVAG